MNRTITAPILAAALIGLTACGTPATATKTTASPSAASAPTAGCTVTKTEEVYVKEMYICTSTKVYVFNTSSARDSWRKAAEEFGSVVVGQGDTWLEVKAD